MAIACAWSGGWISPVGGGEGRISLGGGDAGRISPGGSGSALLYGGGAMEPPSGGDPEVKLTPFAVDRTSCLRLKKPPCPCPAMAEREARVWVGAYAEAEERAV